MKKSKLTAMQKLIKRYTTRQENLMTKLDELRAEYRNARDKLQRELTEITEINEILKKQLTVK